MRLADVDVKYERDRGCGRRKPGGIYLVTDGLGEPCGLLPVALETCHCCGQGIKPSRAWTWIDAAELLEPRPHAGDPHDLWCPLGGQRDVARAGLLWIGEMFYPRPELFTAEAREMGVSRRIPQVPRGFEVGKTWVFVAHRKAIEHSCEHGATRAVGACAYCGGEPAYRYTPGVFHAFLPKRVEYVVRGTETEEELDRLVERGLTPVIVKPLELRLQDGERAA